MKFLEYFEGFKIKDVFKRLGREWWGLCDNPREANLSFYQVTISQSAVHHFNFDPFIRDPYYIPFLIVIKKTLSDKKEIEWGHLPRILSRLWILLKEEQRRDLEGLKNL